MTRHGLWHALRAWLRTGHRSPKVHAELRSFVPSDRVVRYLREVQRRQWRHARMKPRATAS